MIRNLISFLYLAVIVFTLLQSGHAHSSDSPDYVALAKSSLANTEKLSPAFSVSLKTFNMIFSFSPVDGVVLLSGMKTNIEGKAGFLKKFKESTEITFSDYQRGVKGAPF